MNTNEQHRQFFDVPMPGWYVPASYVVRIIGFGAFLLCAWRFTHSESVVSPWVFGGVLGGILLMLLPSLPKAFIEQRNRIRGLAGGTFHEHLQKMEDGDS